ncbi:MAG TPA: hypothetical protein V6D47_00155 [Oscillatoriaceae cyanobacterium]
MTDSRAHALVLVTVSGLLLSGCSWFAQKAHGVTVTPRSGDWVFDAVGARTDGWGKLTDDKGQLALKMTFAPSGTVDVEAANPSVVPSSLQKSLNGALVGVYGDGTWGNGQCTFTLNRKDSDFTSNARSFQFKLTIVSESKLTGEVSVIHTKQSEIHTFDMDEGGSSDKWQTKFSFDSDQQVTGILQQPAR